MRVRRDTTTRNPRSSRRASGSLQSRVATRAVRLVAINEPPRTTLGRVVDGLTSSRLRSLGSYGYSNGACRRPERQKLLVHSHTFPLISRAPQGLLPVSNAPTAVVRRIPVASTLPLSGSNSSPHG